MKQYLLCAGAIAMLAGCAVPAAPAPQLTFANYAPVRLNAASADVQEAYISPNDPQDVAGQFVLPPADAVKRYAANRFNAAGGGSGVFSIVIEDARVHLKGLSQQNKVLNWSGVGKEDEYRVLLQLKIVMQPDGMSGRQSTSIKMDRTLVMPASVTLAERDERQTKFLEKLIADVDARINEALDQAPAMR